MSICSRSWWAGKTISELYSKHSSNVVGCNFPAHEALYMAKVQFVFWKLIENVLVLVLIRHKEALKQNANPESESCD